ncbi:MAG: hypothetical protein PHF57_13065, partial [Methanoregula sp.]|nr:hypothetical protein [Methanoregula sp.]
VGFFEHTVSNDSFTHSGFCINARLSTELPVYGKTKQVEVKITPNRCHLMKLHTKLPLIKTPHIFAILGTND